MLQQEQKHLKYFEELGKIFRIRPTAFMPFWNVAGWFVGVGTAVMGKEAAMACTEAVERIVGNHYNEQLRILTNISKEQFEKMGSSVRIEQSTNEQTDFSIPLERLQMPTDQWPTLESFRRIIRECRDEELEHLDTALEQDALKAPAYDLLSNVIQLGCKVAIEVAKKI